MVTRLALGGREDKGNDNRSPEKKSAKSLVTFM